MKTRVYIIIAVFLNSVVYSQKQTNHWYFGYDAGLDFTSSPPAVDSSAQFSWPSMSASSMSDANGNLLFYTNGEKLYNRLHQVMPNGTGLFNDTYALPNAALIIRKPGSLTNYYVLTSTMVYSNLSHMVYSVVDMSMAGGLGAVTQKNISFNSPVSDYQIAATRHCNGTDYWILIFNGGIPNTKTIRAYQLTASGISTNPVVSNCFVPVAQLSGKTIFSPNGKKFAYMLWYGNSVKVILADFDNTTGQVSNQMVLYSYAYCTGWPCNAGPQGLAFSPDGSKLYQTDDMFNRVLQWYLCAGNVNAIIASRDSVKSNGLLSALQLASDGKIYVARPNEPFLGVIHQPNLPIAAAGYSNFGPSLGNDTCSWGLPNFVSSYFKEIPAFTYTDVSVQSCHTASFSAPQTITSSCGSMKNAYTGYQWNFGDPASGNSNSSTLANPFHTYPAAGQYTVKMIYYSTCYADTFSKVITVGTSVTLLSSTVTCNGLGTATVNAQGAGLYTYTWLPSGQNNSVAVHLTPGIHTLQLTYNAQQCVSVYTLNIAPVQMSGVILYTASCSGGTAEVVVTGGSGSYQILWNNLATAQVINYSAPGTYTVSVYDNLNQCSVVASASLSLPSTPTIMISSSRTICAGNSVEIYANGASDYLWEPGGLTGGSIQVSPSSGSTYTVTGSGAQFDCTASKVVSVEVIACTHMATRKDATHFRVYPSVIEQDINIHGIQGSVLTISDLQNRLLYSCTLNNEKELKDLTFLESGIYFLKIRAGTSSATFKIVRSGK